jgi:RimJ/RimL family protein N-acetyltransferase
LGVALEKQVILRQLDISDREIIYNWITSPAIIHYSVVVAGPHNLALEMTTRAYAERYFDILLSDNSRVTYVILFNHISIGTVGLKEIENNNADCFIDIGEKIYRNHGLGSLAMTQLLNIAFNSLGLAEISLDVLEFNRAALKLYNKLGFVAHRSYGWHYDEFGLYWRVLRMSLAKKEWLTRSNI